MRHKLANGLTSLRLFADKDKLNSLNKSRENLTIRSTMTQESEENLDINLFCERISALEEAPPYNG